MAGWVCPGCQEVERDSMIACQVCQTTAPHAASYFRFLSKLWFALRMKKSCPDCGRIVATREDDGSHNTGACGCAASRALCWRLWNDDKCCAESPYAP